MEDLNNIVVEQIVKPKRGIKFLSDEVKEERRLLKEQHIKEKPGRKILILTDEEKLIKKQLAYEKIKQWKKENYENNVKIYNKEYMKKYVKESVPIICGCGGKYRNYNKYRHFKSLKCLKFHESK